MYWSGPVGPFLVRKLFPTIKSSYDPRRQLQAIAIFFACIGADDLLHRFIGSYNGVHLILLFKANCLASVALNQGV